MVKNYFNTVIATSKMQELSETSTVIIEKLKELPSITKQLEECCNIFSTYLPPEFPSSLTHHQIDIETGGYWKIQGFCKQGQLTNWTH